MDPTAVPQSQLEQGARAGDAGAQIALGNRLLATHSFASTEHARGLDLLRTAAAGPRASEASWFLGAYYLQVTAHPGAHAEAARWLQRAADAGVAPAIDRLAGLHVIGLGVPHDLVRARALQRRLAEHGFQRAAFEYAYLLGQGEDADPAASATAFARASAIAHPPAYYALGLRFAEGRGVSADPAFARALLLRAADGRHPDARAAADALVPESQAGTAAADWYRRLKHNLDTAQPLLSQLLPPRMPVGTAPHPQLAALEAHFAALGHPALRVRDGRLEVVAGGAAHPALPAPFEWLAQQPRVAVSRPFADREECAHVMQLVGESLAQASDYRNRSSANDDAEVLHFTGSGRPLGALLTDSVTRTLERRVLQATGWRAEALEPGSVIRYRPGESYSAHVDYFTAEQIERNRRELADRGGQRIATFLLYLCAPEAGGETLYDRAELAVCGEPGMAVLHYNVTTDGRPDDASLHTGRVIERGEKWLWRTTLREHPLYPPAATG